jgi:ubiquinone/menaquinone biosynthesis C-methylase UbiE
MFARVTHAFIPVLLDAARVAAGRSILDVATGTGAAARDRAEPGGEVIAGDISATMLDVARRNPENAGITFEPLDGHKLPYPDARFDRVICQLGLAFFDDPGLGLAEFRRVLKPSGRAAAIVNSPPERSLYFAGTEAGPASPARSTSSCLPRAGGPFARRYGSHFPTTESDRPFVVDMEILIGTAIDRYVRFLPRKGSP